MKPMQLFLEPGYFVFRQGDIVNGVFME